MRFKFIQLLFFISIVSGVSVADASICRQIKTDTSLKSQDKVSSFNHYRGYSKARYHSWVRTSLYVPVRDGVKLAVDVIRPAKDCKKVTQRLPVIVMQTPYQRAFVQTDGSIGSQLVRHGWQQLVSHGYVFVIFSVRGTGASFGRYTMPLIKQERQDAYDVIEWAAKQDFSTGAVGMMGDSYQGMVQLMAAALQPPHLKAIFPETAPFDFYRLVYPGGIFRSSFLTYWAHEVSEMNLLNRLVPVDSDPQGIELMQARQAHDNNLDVLSEFKSIPYHDEKTDYYSWDRDNSVNFIKQINESHIPIYLSGSWYDVFSSDTLFWYDNLTVPKKMLIGGWPHNTYNAPESVRDQREHINNTEALRWFDYWLKEIPNGVMKEDPVHYTVIDKDYRTGLWYGLKDWPKPSVKSEKWFLDSKNRLSLNKPLSLLHDNYTANYTTSSGHLSRWNNANGEGFIDYSGLTNNDKKSLIYTTPKLSHTITLLGFPQVSLILSANVPDIDVHVILESVDTHDISHYLTEGMLRASQYKLTKPKWKNEGLPFHSHDFEDRDELQDGKTYILNFHLYPVARNVKAGDRLRLVIMNADMNNTDAIYYSLPVKIKLYHGGADAAYLVLPVDTKAVSE